MDGKKLNWTERLANATFGGGNWTYDIEGCPIPKEEAKLIAKIMEETTFKIQLDPPSRPILFGTGGSFENSNFENIFYNSNFNTKDES